MREAQTGFYMALDNMYYSSSSLDPLEQRHFIDLKISKIISNEWHFKRAGILMKTKYWPKYIIMHPRDSLEKEIIY